jgi:hypothetical protein
MTQTFIPGKDAALEDSLSCHRVRKARNDTDFADDPLSRRDNFTGLVFTPYHCALYAPYDN